MRRFIASALMICAVTATARPAGAAFYSAAKLHEVCTAKDETRILLSACVGYVTGAFDFLLWRKGACVPETVSMAHLTDLVMIYLQEHPEKRDLIGAEIVAAVTKDNWPCPK